MKSKMLCVLMISLLVASGSAFDQIDQKLLTLNQVQRLIETALENDDAVNLPTYRITEYSQQLVERLDERGIKSMRSDEVERLIQQYVMKNLYQASEQKTQSLKKSASVAAAVEQDSLALVALYNSTDGDNWSDNSNWLTAAPIDTWYGLTVLGGQVIQINLGWNNLNGVLPPELGNLSMLEHLSFFSNNLSGAIPAQIGNLSMLEYLSLSWNNLSGGIPPELGNLSVLKHLALWANNLSGIIPAQIGNLSMLEHLDLDTNNLSGAVPPELGNLLALQTLYLCNNQFTDLPDLTTLTALSNIWCGNNRLTFEDLEPNMGLPIHYTPQDSVDISGRAILSVSVDGSANFYQWFKDDIAIPGEVLDELSIDPITEAKFGTYHCEITNPLVPGLVLSSRKKRIDFLPTIEAIVWYDVNENGVVDFNECGLGGVQVRIPLDNNTCKHRTNDQGSCTFRLPDGPYTVHLVESELPDGAICTTGGYEIPVVLNEDNLSCTVLFGLAGDNVAPCADEPVIRPLQGEEIADDALVFVEGSPTFCNNVKNYCWDNAVDGDRDGWDGTTLAGIEQSYSEVVPYAIFAFGNSGSYKFNCLTYQTDNGTADDGAKYDNQCQKLEVLVSTTGMNQSDFTSIGIFDPKNNPAKLQWHGLGDFVTAKYIKLRMVSPMAQYVGGFIQIVEFSISVDKVSPLIPVSYSSELAVVPEAMDLLYNYPNPFNPTTTIAYRIQEDAQVSLKIYDLTGKQVAELKSGKQAAGQYQITWNAHDMPSGVYFITMQAGTEKATKRILLIK